VDGNGAITSVNYYSNSQALFPNGGVGYNFSLPSTVVAQQATGTIKMSTTSNVVTGNGTSFTTQFVNGATLMTNTNVVIGTVQSVYNANTLYLTSNAYTTGTGNGFYLGTAILSVPATLGTGATVTATTSRIGAITSFNIIDNGQDYVSAPSVSLKVQDLIVSNVSPTNLPASGDLIYQGANTSVASYIAYVDSVIELQNANPSNNSIYQLRVYNYTSVPNASLKLNNDSSGYHISLVSGASPSILSKTTFGNDARFDTANGIITYGDGHAQATASFLDGLVIGQGQYLDTSGQPSSFDVLQSTLYNNYTYEITLNTEISKYRDMLLNLLHPTGMQVIGRISISSNSAMNFSTEDALYTGKPLSYYTNAGTTAKIFAGTASNPSNNIITFTNLLGANLANIFVANTSYVSFSYGSNYDDAVQSLVVGINNSSNSITIQDNVWTYFANVATGTAQAGNNYIINISTLTGSYDIVNNGNYSNTQLPMADVIRVGDSLTVNGVAQTVTSINYSTNIANSIVVLSGPLTNGANGLISIGRNLISIDDSLKIFGPVGVPYLLELTTENGNTLITEDGNTLLIG
jgi:hypothetical protein